MIGSNNINESHYAFMANLFIHCSLDSGWGFNKAQILDICNKHKPNTITLFFTLMLNSSAHASCPHKTVYGVKTPNLIFDLKTIYKLYPTSKIIHVVRDGRDVYASYNELYTSLARPFGPNTIVSASMYWTVGLLHVAFFKKRNPEAILEIRYEDLADNPNHTLSRVLSFIGVGDDRLLFKRFANIKNANSMVPEIHLHTIHKNVCQPISTKSIGRYKNTFTALDKALFEMLSYQYLKYYQYTINIVNNSIYSIFYKLAIMPLILICLLYNKYRYKERENRTKMHFLQQ